MLVALTISIRRPLTAPDRNETPLNLARSCATKHPPSCVFIPSHRAPNWLTFPTGHRRHGRSADRSARIHPASAPERRRHALDTARPSRPWSLRSQKLCQSSGPRPAIAASVAVTGFSEFRRKGRIRLGPICHAPATLPLRHKSSYSRILIHISTMPGLIFLLSPSAVAHVIWTTLFSRFSMDPYVLTCTLRNTP